MQPITNTRPSAWGRLGIGVEDLSTGYDVLSAANMLGWNVRKVRMQSEPILTENGVFTLNAPNKFLVIRDNDEGVPFALGVEDEDSTAHVVGKDYTHHQNEDTIELLDNLVQASDGAASYAAAGQTNGGADTFVTMKLGDTIQIGGADPVDHYVVVRNNHVGRKTLSAQVMAIRLVCANGLKMTTRVGDTFSVRHTERGMKADMEEARRILDLTVKWGEVFAREAEKMVATTMTEREFRRIIETEFGAKEGDSERSKAYAETRINKLTDLFNVAGTNEAIRNTRWAAYNAFTELYDHHAIVRGENANAARAEKVVNGGFDKEKATAWARFAVKE